MRRAFDVEELDLVGACWCWRTSWRLDSRRINRKDEGREDRQQTTRK